MHDQWVGIGPPLAFTVGFVVALFIYRHITTRRASNSQPEDRKGQAYLVPLNDQTIHYAITKSPWRIGRQGDNDLTFEDPSVSRQHAEILRNPDGTYMVTDLESLNGVFVNNTKVLTSTLTDGDRIELGNIHLIFTLQPGTDPK